MSHNYDYDAIIIGAGIGGLVCGCYLAKAGMKVLIVEKNAKVGGYCTSFTRNGFQFDACAHSLGGLQAGGVLSRVLRELQIEISFKRCDPLNVIITPKYKVNFWANHLKTIQELQLFFPKESQNIIRFIDFVSTNKDASFCSLRNTTFKDILDKYFTDSYLKTIFSYPLFGSSGLPPSLISGITAVTIYRDSIMNGGYYIEEGIQKLPEALVQRFKALGGEIVLSTLLSKIIVDKNCAKGIKLNNGDLKFAKYLVSNIDARKTFIDLIGEEHLDKEFVHRLKSLKPTLSSFNIYIGLDKGCIIPFQPNTSVWFSSNADPEEIYVSRQRGEITQHTWFLLFVSTDKSGITLQTNVAYQSQEYWEKNKEKLCDFFMQQIGQIIPDIAQYSVTIDIAAPHSLYRMTSNYLASSFGWESTIPQFATLGLSQITPISDLFLTGHWTTLVQGVSGVAYLGSSTARLVLSKAGISFIQK